MKLTIFLSVVFLLLFTLFIKIVYLEKGRVTIVEIEKSDNVGEIGVIEEIVIYIPNESCNCLELLECVMDGDLDKRERVEFVFECIKENSKGFLGENVKLLNVYFEREKLYLNFNDKIRHKMKSSEEELTIIYSIVNSMVELDGIKEVKFLVEDREVKKMCGRIDTNKFFKKDSLLIRE